MSLLLTPPFRDLIQQNGEPVRWWKCFRDVPFGLTGPNGEAVNRDNQLFIEQTLADDVRMYCHDVIWQNVEGEAFQHADGQLNFACMPDEIELSNGDRVLLIDRRVLWRQNVDASGGARVRLERDFAVDLTVISGGAGTLEVEADGASYVSWQGEPSTALVEFSFVPGYSFLDESDRNQPRGSDGVRLPQRGILTLENHLNGN